MKIGNIKIEKGTDEAGIVITDTKTGRTAIMSRTILECLTQLTYKQTTAIDHKIINQSCNNE